MSPKIVDKDEKKKIIGEKALSLFAQNGFASSSMSQVAQVTGIGKGTIYEYFKSKDELIAYSLKLYVETIEEGVDSLIDRFSDPKEQLRIYTLGVAEKIIADPTTTGVVLAIFQLLILSNGSSAHKGPLKGMFKNARETIKRILKKGASDGVFRQKADLEAESIAINLIAYIDGIWMHSLVNDDIDLKKQVNHFLDDLFFTIEPKG